MMYDNGGTDLITKT